MRDRDERLRNEVEHPERYQEVTITSAGVPIVLSVWHGRSDGPVVVFLPGTMTHPMPKPLLDVGRARTISSLYPRTLRRRRWQLAVCFPGSA